MAVTIKLRRGTTSEWSSYNPVLAEGEVGIDLTLDKFKIGDGTTPWNSLGYAAATVAELNLKAPLDSPSLTGVPTAPTASADTNTTQIATTQYVVGQGYLKSNQSISVSGDATGSGTTSINLTLANSGVSASTYGSSSQIPILAVDAKGRITSASTASVEGLPNQSGNNGKYLTTNGSSASWDTIDLGTDTQGNYVSQVTSNGSGLSITGSGESASVVIENTGVTALSGTANEIEVSASTGSITVSLPSTINANTTGSAATLTNARTIALGGDLSGSASFDGSASISITADIQPNSVVLGTDTTGNYVATASAGAGISISGSGSENAAITISNTGVRSLTGTANQISVSASSGAITVSLPSTINANTTGSAATLTTSRTIELSGDVSGSATFNGSANASITSTLANTAVTPAAYGSASATGVFTVDSKGRITGASNTPIVIGQSSVTNLTTDLSAKAPLNSPNLTGVPTAPTAASGTSTTQIATTAFVSNALSNVAGGSVQTTEPSSPVEGYIWVDSDGNSSSNTGFPTVIYSPTDPSASLTNADIGTIWIDEDDTTGVLNVNNYLTTASANANLVRIDDLISPFLLSGM